MAVGSSNPVVSEDRARRAREMWRLLEPVHAVVYFAPDARERFRAAGLKGFWMGYFASRAAALGPVGAEPVIAAFNVFHPAMVARALPAAWELAPPDQVLDTRLSLAHDTLRAVLGESADGREVREAAEIAVELARRAPRSGRPLGAAHAALPVPDDPLLRLWWAATALREHRGDGHVAALLIAGIDPCEALILAASGRADAAEELAMLQRARGWPDDEWTAAIRRLADRGWLDASGRRTEAGRDAYARVEHVTDEVAAAAYTRLSDAELDTLAAALTPVTLAVLRSGVIPDANPIGLDTTPPSPTP